MPEFDRPAMDEELGQPKSLHDQLRLHVIESWEKASFCLPRKDATTVGNSAITTLTDVCYKLCRFLDTICQRHEIVRSSFAELGIFYLKCNKDEPQVCCHAVR